MATIRNRSAFRVSVRNNDTLTREFAFNRLVDVETYLAVLRSRGLKPRVVTLDDIWP